MIPCLTIMERSRLAAITLLSRGSTTMGPALRELSFARLPSVISTTAMLITTTETLFSWCHLERYTTAVEYSVHRPHTHMTRTLSLLPAVLYSMITLGILQQRSTEAIKQQSINGETRMEHF